MMPQDCSALIRKRVDLSSFQFRLKTLDILVLKLTRSVARVVLIVPRNILKQSLNRNLPTLADLIDELSQVG